MSLTKDENISQYFFFFHVRTICVSIFRLKVSKPINHHAGNMNTKCSMVTQTDRGYIFGLILKALVIKN